MTGYGWHPDEGLSGFSLDQGWCAQCGCVLRGSGAKWYGSDSSGPFCSTECLRKAIKQGGLPDYVREFRADGRPILGDAGRARDFRLPKGSLYPDEALTEEQREALSAAGEEFRRQSGVPRAFLRETPPKVLPGSGGAW
jgi:hypothetical protein